jgi:hypothetical protein
MNDENYLRELLASERLDERSDEWKSLDDEAAKIEEILRAAHPYSGLTFTHGGSRAKGTMIREDYDLDEVLYFRNEDDSCGETLEKIYDNVAGLMEKHYKVRRKRSALRLSMKDGSDLKVDLVPGRYMDDTMTDVFIHQNEGSKEKLKTNIVKQIDHIVGSGCVDEITLGKLWRTRNGLKNDLRTFPLELLVIEALEPDASGGLQDRFERVLSRFADEISELQIKDPANPEGNDLSYALPDKLRNQIAKVAQNTLATARKHGWEQVFGKVEARSVAPRVQILRSAAAASVPARPWAGRK